MCELHTKKCLVTFVKKLKRKINKRNRPKLLFTIVHTPTKLTGSPFTS